jgi:hypothetical protein
LTERDAQAAQRFVLRFRFDAFGNDFHPIVLRHGGDRAYQFAALPVDLSHELAVDFHVVERKAAEQIDVAVLRAEIVDRELNAVRLQAVEDRLDAWMLLQQKALGDFEHERDVVGQFVVCG